MILSQGHQSFGGTRQQVGRGEGKGPGAAVKIVDLVMLFRAGTMALLVYGDCSGNYGDSRNQCIDYQVSMIPVIRHSAMAWPGQVVLFGVCDSAASIKLLLLTSTTSCLLSSPLLRYVGASIAKSIYAGSTLPLIEFHLKRRCTTFLR